MKLERTKIGLDVQKVKINLDVIYISSLSKGSVVSSEMDVVDCCHFLHDNIFIIFVRHKSDYHHHFYA